MLFFFELFLFLLIMLTLGLAEFVNLGAALGVWLTCTAASLVGYVLASRSVRRPNPPAPFPEGRGEDGSPLPFREGGSGGLGPSLDEKWGRTLLYNWRRTNALLVLGALVVGVWYWLGAGPS